MTDTKQEGEPVDLGPRIIEWAAQTPSIRQMYKMAAIQGILGNCFKQELINAGPVQFKKSLNDFAVQIADAMIAEDIEHSKKP